MDSFLHNVHSFLFEFLGVYPASGFITINPMLAKNEETDIFRIYPFLITEADCFVLEGGYQNSPFRFDGKSAVIVFSA